MGEKMKLYGFNNLTKSLSFNIYDVCYAKTAREQMCIRDRDRRLSGQEGQAPVRCEASEGDAWIRPPRRE